MNASSLKITWIVGCRDGSSVSLDCCHDEFYRLKLSVIDKY